MRCDRNKNIYRVESVCSDFGLQCARNNKRICPTCDGKLQLTKRKRTLAYIICLLVVVGRVLQRNGVLYMGEKQHQWKVSVANAVRFSFIIIIIDNNQTTAVTASMCTHIAIKRQQTNHRKSSSISPQSMLYSHIDHDVYVAYVMWIIAACMQKSRGMCSIIKHFSNIIVAVTAAAAEEE